MATSNYILADEYLASGEHDPIIPNNYTNYVLQALPLEGQWNIFKEPTSYTFTRLQFARKYAAFFRQNPALDLFYNRIWVTEKVEFGLISELAVKQINIWNAFLSSSISITGFVNPGDQGIAIETISPPVSIARNTDVDYDVTVFVTGPAEQNTTYEFTIAGALYEVQVTGSRLILFDFDLNWADPEKIIYEYFTSIYTAPTGQEYRRGLASVVTRRSSFYYSLDGIEAHRYLNIVRYGRARFILIPVYQEGFYSAGALTGALAITGSENLQYHWNLKNYSTYILIVDHANKISEAKSIASIVGNVINVSKVVLNTFDPDTAIIYPAYVAMVQDYSYRNITNKVIDSNITFQEVRPNAL